MGQVFCSSKREKEVVGDNLVDAPSVIDGTSESHSHLNENFLSEFKPKTVMCTICCDDVLEEKMINTGHCGHQMCEDCLTHLVQSKLKNLASYPITCPFCTICIERSTLELILSPEDCKVWDYFTVRHAIPYEEQYECPECSHVFYRESWPLPSEVDWIESELVTQCLACGTDFNLFKWKHHCRSCGRVLCHDCSNNYLFSNEDQKLARTCQICYGDYFRSVCQNNDCLLKFCTVCLVKWHKGQTCEEYQNSTRHSQEFEKLTSEAIRRLGYSQCPRCGLTISKDEGCNHMTHTDCPKAYEENGKTHFCYCCNQLLKAPYWHEPDGTVHFEAGLFEACHVKAGERNEEILQNVLMIGV